MYCTKCGKEVRDGETFCGSCGTQVGQNNKVASLDTIQGRLKAIEGCRLAFLLAVIMPIMSMMFLEETMYSVSYEIFGYRNTMHFGAFEGKDFLMKIFLAGYIAAVVMLILPIFTEAKWDTKNYALGWMMPVAAAVILIWGVLDANNQVKTGEFASLLEAVDTEISLAENAWYFIAANIAMLISVYSASQKIAAAQYRIAKEEAEREEERRREKKREREIQNVEERIVVAEHVIYEDGSWQCTCGRKNRHYVTGCVCGEPKFIDKSWQCACGRKNENNVTVCACGKRKPEDL